MPEEIKAVLTSDPKAFESGIDRAIAALTTLEKRVAKPQKAALPILELNPRILKDLDRAAATTQELARRTMMAGRSGQMGAMGFLSFSQAVEDAQYGIRGVLNNIPMMIMGFGGGMGLAGAISLAAVAAVTLYPHLQKLNGAAYNEAVAKGAEQWAKIFEEGMAAANAIESEADSAARLLDLSRLLNQSYAERVSLGATMADYYDDELAAAKAERDYQAGILADRQKMVESLGGDVRPFITARQTMEVRGNDADLANRRKELETLIDNQNRLTKAKNNIADESDERAAYYAKQLAQETRNLADEKGRLAAMQSEVAATSGQERKENNDSVASITATVSKIESRIAALKEERQAQTDAGNAAKSEAEKNLSATDAKIKKTYEEIKSLEDKAKKLEEIQSRELKLQQTKELLAAQAAAKDAKPELEKAAETAKSRENSTRELTDSLEVLRKSAQEGKKAGDKLKDELNLKRDAKDVAEKTGLSEEKATKLLEERKKLEEDLAKVPKGSIKERAADRARERAEKREEMRNDRVAEAQRKRDARGQDGKPVDFNKGREDLNNILKDAERKRAEAEKNLAQNIEKQTKLQEEIKKAITAISAA